MTSRLSDLPEISHIDEGMAVRYDTKPGCHFCYYLKTSEFLGGLQSTISLRGKSSQDYGINIILLLLTV